MTYIAKVTVFSIFLLAACSTDTAEFPAASVLRFEDGTEWVMTGTLFGNRDGSSRTILSGSGITCETNLTRQPGGVSVGTNTCTETATGKVVFQENTMIPAGEVKMGFNGKYITEVDYSGTTFMGKVQENGKGVVAFGWGRYAKPDVLRNLLP